MKDKRSWMIIIALFWCSVAYSFYQLTPIDEQGRFFIDESVETLYLLAPNQTQKQNIILEDPEHHQFDHRTRSLGFKWLKKKDLEWAEIHLPLRGQWQIKQQSSLAYLILKTNLGIKSNDIPSQVFLNQIWPIELSIIENGEIIERNQFIDPLVIQMKQHSKNNHVVDERFLKDTFEILSPAELSKGVLRKKFEFKGPPDLYQIDIMVKGKTFRRLVRYNVNVNIFPFEVILKDNVSNESDQKNYLSLKSTIKHLSITADIKDPLNIYHRQALIFDTKQNQFNLVLPRIFSDQFYQVQLYIEGKTEKNAFKIISPIYRLKGLVDQKSIEQNLKAYTPQIPFRLKEPQPRLPKPKPKVVKEQPKKIPWYQKTAFKITMIIVLLMMICLSVVGFFYWKKKKNLAKLSEKENNDETQAVEPTTEEPQQETTLQGTGIKSSDTKNMAQEHDNNE